MPMTNVERQARHCAKKKVNTILKCVWSRAMTPNTIVPDYFSDTIMRHEQRECRMAVVQHGLLDSISITSGCVEID